MPSITAKLFKQQTDRELLELAARAIGERLSWMTNGKAAFIGDDIWSPLDDDGDALRLAVSLSIDILHRYVGGTRVEALAPGGPVVEEFCKGESRAEATRRAIVRAAAAIGEGK